MIAFAIKDLQFWVWLNWLIRGSGWVGPDIDLEVVDSAA